jgi:hypothetical protein
MASSLADVAKQVVAPRAIESALAGGPASRRLADYVQNRVDGDPRGYAESTVATVAWHILRHAQAYQSLVMRLEATPAIWRLGDFVVTPLDEGSSRRFVLLALDPTLPVGKAPRNGRVSVELPDLRRAYERWVATQILGQADYRHALAEATIPEIVEEFERAQGFEIVVAPMPLDIETMAERPTPPFGIRDNSGSQTFSMGVYSASKMHGPGLTTAAHGIAAGTQYDVVDASGNKIDTVQGVQTNAVLDAAFLQLSGAPHIQSPAGTSFLSGVTPNAQLQHEFHGAQSGVTQATISGWVDDLLTIEPWLQNRVFTQRVLQRRDSGSALIDANDRVVGFAFYNSSAFASSALSAWIWGDSVRTDFQLT